LAAAFCFLGRPGPTKSSRPASSCRNRLRTRLLASSTDFSDRHSSAAIRAAGSPLRTCREPAGQGLSLAGAGSGKRQTTMSLLSRKAQAATNRSSAEITRPPGWPAWKLPAVKRDFLPRQQLEHDHLWDLAGWKAPEPRPPCRVLPANADRVGSLAFSPDGALRATAGGTSGQPCLWDLASGWQRPALAGHLPHTSQVAFSPDRRSLASGAMGRLDLWDVQTGQRHESPIWNDHTVWTVAFSPDGRLLACGNAQAIQVIDRKLQAATSGGSAVQLRLWDMATGEEQAGRVRGRRPGPGLPPQRAACCHHGPGRPQGSPLGYHAVGQGGAQLRSAGSLSR
jgi:hypothetical protein